MVDPADKKVTTTKGDPAPGTQAGSAPEPIDPETGQHGAYWVLTEEERAKGFVRPVRRSYIHAGVRPQHPTRPLTDEEKGRYDSYGYIAFEAYPDAEETGRPGRFWTEAQLNSGCGAVTTMGQSLAETWARDPAFYGATFCATCRDHFPVAQFQWDDEKKEVLGS